MALEKLDRVLVYFLEVDRNKGILNDQSEKSRSEFDNQEKTPSQQDSSSVTIGEFCTSVVNRIKMSDQSDGRINDSNHAGARLLPNVGPDSVWVNWSLRGHRLIVAPVGVNLANTVGTSPMGSFATSTETTTTTSTSLTSPSSNCYLLTRPSFCPVTNLSEDQKCDLPKDVLERGIATGVAVLVEVRDQILLTRRPQHMRTFPRVWVPPGGHIEVGETFLEAGLRELREETGLELSVDAISSTKCLGLWESVYPPTLTSGLPQRHHVVFYILVRVGGKFTEEVEQRLKLDPDETEATVWVDRNLASDIVSTMEGVDVSFLPVAKAQEVAAIGGELATALSSGHPRQLEIIRLVKSSDTYAENEEASRPKIAKTTEIPNAKVAANWRQEKSTMSSSSLLNVARKDGSPDVERVSTGTKYALALWLAQED